MDAIHKERGACVILAGAGTGKTHTIVEKLKHLIKEKSYSPEKIVCITFSNEAANNLLSRVRKSIKFDGTEPVIKTFHALSADLLRKYGEKIDIPEDFKILDPDQAKIVLHSSFKITPYYCHRYISSISTSKDFGITIEELESFLEGGEKKFEGVDIEKKLESLQFELQTMHLKFEADKKKELVSLIDELRNILGLRKFVTSWKAYEKLKKKKNYQDYSDLNSNALKLLQEVPEAREEFDYVIVDEFQDTNKVQLDMLFSLAEKGNITIVGDLNQSIYRFRGAYKENFNEFKKHFSITKEDQFNLDKSYRSSNKILSAAHNLIINNYENPEDCFEVKNFEDREGDPVEVYSLKNSKEEARKVYELVQREIAEGKRPEDICIVFRTHQQGRVIKNYLEMHGIDYSSVNKTSLLKLKNIRTVIDYITILEKLKTRSKGGEQAWWDLIYQMDFLESDLIKVGKYIKENRDSENLSAKLLSSLSSLDLSSSGKLASKILVEKIKALIPSLDESVSEIVKQIYSVSGLVKKDISKEGKENYLNLNKFYELVKEQSSLHGFDLSGFIYYLDMMKNLDIDIEASEVEKSGVRLMTLHSTKGLEYKTVILTNMAQKRFPILRYVSNSLVPSELHPEIKDLGLRDEKELKNFVYDYEQKHQLFEERRLCYVAFTRAREKLIMTYSEEYGSKKFWPSQFLEEISFKENPDFEFLKDSDEKYEEPELEFKSALSISSLFGKENFEDSLVEVLKKTDRNEVDKSPKNLKFSPSALLLFSRCQKKYEYKYVYNMPDDKIVSWEAIRLGSFVHQVLEDGVRKNFRSLKKFLDYARDLSDDEDWESVDFSEAEHLIKVFYERNKDKYSEHSKTEQVLKLKLAGLNFIGFADRIDYRDDGLEIIDYKTSKSALSPRDRNWQLGFYALAAASLGNVKRITIDMLRLDKPLEFDIDEKGNAEPRNSTRMSGFNIYEVEQEIIKEAHSILKAYESEFKPCSMESNCEFCNEYVYGN